MTQVEYWTIYIFLAAIFVMLWNISRRLAVLHTDNLIAQEHRNKVQLNDSVRDLADVVLRFGPQTLPDDVVERIFGGVAEMVREEDETNNGGTQR